MDEDEDAEEKRRRMEAKIAAENFGAVIGLAAGAALAGWYGVAAIRGLFL